MLLLAALPWLWPGTVAAGFGRSLTWLYFTCVPLFSTCFQQPARVRESGRIVSSLSIREYVKTIEFVGVHGACAATLILVFVLIPHLRIANRERRRNRRVVRSPENCL